MPWKKDCSNLSSLSCEACPHLHKPNEKAPVRANVSMARRSTVRTLRGCDAGRILHVLLTPLDHKHEPFFYSISTNDVEYALTCPWETSRSRPCDTLPRDKHSCHSYQGNPLTKKQPLPHLSARSSLPPASFNPRMDPLVPPPWVRNPSTRVSNRKVAPFSVRNARISRSIRTSLYFKVHLRQAHEST